MMFGTVDPTQWIAKFRVVHERAKAKQLSEDETKSYHAMREELAKSLVAAQSLQVSEDRNFRKNFRVAQVFKLEIDRTYQAMTKEVSRSGFSALMPAELKVGQKVGFSMTLSRAVDPISGEAKVVSAVKAGMWRIDFNIILLNDDYAEKLESALYDAVLARFK